MPPKPTRVQVITVDGVDRFVVEGEAGAKVHGSTHKVVRALDTKHNMTVVLKIGAMEELTKERDIYLQLIGISGIPGLYGWCLTSPTVSYLSLQPFTEDLYHYVTANGPMPLRQVCRVVGTALTVLSSAHAKNIIHCDIKPQNVVYSPSGEQIIGVLAVIDWGLAVGPGVEKRGLYSGTPAFMSVSCLSGKPHVMDDIESLLYLIEFLRKADLPWGWPSIPEDVSYEDLKEEKECYSPEELPLQEFLVYARDQRSDNPPNYKYLRGLLLEASRLDT